MTSDAGSDAVARIRPTELKKGAVIAQSLDNQWVSAELTRTMVEQGKSLRDVEETRGTEVRAEYFRSLINTRQLVANRVFFYNNRAVSRDLVEGGAARRAHQKLLADGTLVPFLLNEKEPAERPPAWMDIDEEAFTAWQETVARMPASERLTCLRMSWDDQENRTDTRNALFNPFAARVQGLTAKDIPLLASQVGVPVGQVDRFAARIGEVVQLSNELRTRNETVTRSLLYEEFVSVPGVPVSDGRYDRNKPFAGEVKQLLDLIYSVNLADALGMYPLTPNGSLRRVALQEWRDLRGGSGGGRTITDPEELLLFLRRQVFSTVQDRLTLAAVDSLRLEDIWNLRQSDPWHDYMDAFDALTADPLGYSDRLGLVFDRYVRLNSELIRIVKSRPRAGELDANKWMPVVETVVTVGGAVFTAMTGDEIWSLTGSLGAATSRYGGSVQLVLRNRREGRREQKFAREMATVRFDTVREWNQFLSMVRGLPGYAETGGPTAATSSATIQENDEIPEY
ncbi:hypothetical protein ACFYT4_04365 [Streptomyces sp. NPDC004609]|uniref:hypothetical protein n=1 Tax=Streptomyces sp. NPDC004609 TaxID=3364704 RepID=UPI00367BEBA4